VSEPLKRILVVEDNPEDAEVFRHYLERDSEGFICTIAISGDAGLKLMSEREFDCVLLDQGLPGLSGLEILDAFAASGLPCAVVMLTGIGDERLAVAAMRMGAEDYLNKNHLTRERLHQVVNNALKSFDLRRRLEREQHRNEAILASISDAFFAFDREWNFTYVNPSGQQLMGRSADDLIGQNLWNVVPELRDTVFETGLQRATESATPSTFEALFLSRQRWLEVRVYPTKSSVSVYAADITNRKRDEERRRLLETVALSANDAIIITQAEPKEEPGPRILYVNPAFEALSGYTAAEVLGRSPRFLQGPGSSRETLDVIRDALKAWQPVQAEVLNYRKDGTSFWVELSIAPVADDSGSFTHWVSVQRDITERKQAEESLRESVAHYRHSVDLNPQIPWTADPAGNILEISTRWTDVTGVSHESLLGASWLEATHSDESPQVVAAWTHALQTGDPHDVEHRVKLADGSYTWMHSRAYARRDENGQIVRWYGSTEDIHPRKMAEKALQESEERYRQIAEAQKRFVSDAAHELCAPLTGIRGNLELLSRYPDILTEERVEMMDDAQRETSRLGRLITDLLALARGDAGQHIEFAPLRLDTLLAESLRNARHLAQAHQLEFGQLPEVTVLGDSNRLKQLALILFENALKYTPPGGTVQVSLSIQGDGVVLRVSDNGPGIAPEELERVFNRFYRVDRSRTPGRDPGGTGLGLPIARSVAESHGGKVWLESGLGVGTTAVVWLPLASQVDGIAPDVMGLG